MKRLFAVLVLLAVLVAGCMEAPEGYLYEFKVYSNGQLIYHDAVYAYILLDDGKYKLYKTQNDMNNDEGVTVSGDMVIAKIRIEDWQAMNNEGEDGKKLSAYPLQFTDTPEPPPVIKGKTKTDTLGVEYK